MLTYGLSADEAHRFGLPCGGTLQFVLEPVCAQSRLPERLQVLQRQELVTRTLNLDTGVVSLKPSAQVSVLRFDGQCLTAVHGPREEYLNEWDVEGVELSRDMPDDPLLRLQLDARSPVLTLTHDPQLDDMALLEALKSPAFYVGAIGSRTNKEKRRERLALFDIREAEISRLHGHADNMTPDELVEWSRENMSAYKVPRYVEFRDSLPKTASGKVMRRLLQ